MGYIPEIAVFHMVYFLIWNWRYEIDGKRQANMGTSKLQKNALFAAVTFSFLAIVSPVVLSGLTQFITFLPLHLTLYFHVSQTYCIAIGFVIWTGMSAALARLLCLPLPLHSKIKLSLLFSFALLVIMWCLVTLLNALIVAGL